MESEKSKKTKKGNKIEIYESKRTEIVSRLESKIAILKKSNKNMYDINSAFKSGFTEGIKKAYEEFLEALKWIKNNYLLN